jgi:NitT/TauT family transport system ATP-binding protein
VSTAAAAPPAVGIRIDGVGHRFVRRGRDIDALSAVSLDVAPGELVSLLGPSGCGKTTLLRAVAGLLRPSLGTVSVGDRSPDAARRAKQIGWVPQSAALLPWRSAVDNITLLDEVNKKSDRERAATRSVGELIERTGLAGFEGALPHELSGGMRQRVALARAMALDPPVMLMDEPFAALDELTRAEMRHLLLDVRGDAGATCLFVTHSVDEAVLLSDRVAVLSPRPGRIVAVETIDLPRPRPDGIEDEPTFHDHVRRLRSLLREPGR